MFLHVIEVDFRQFSPQCAHGNYFSAFEVWNQINLRGGLLDKKHLPSGLGCRGVCNET